MRETSKSPVLAFPRRALLSEFMPTRDGQSRLSRVATPLATRTGCASCDQAPDRRHVRAPLLEHPPRQRGREADQLADQLENSAREAVDNASSRLSAAASRAGTTIRDAGAAVNPANSRHS